MVRRSVARRTRKWLTFFSAFMLLAIWPCIGGRGLAAEDATGIEQAFVDLNGDGINDNAPDLNDDGIPDKCQAQKTTAPSSNDRFAAFASDLRTGLDLTELDSAPLSQKFGRRFFVTRGLHRSRSAFEAGLGFDSGLGFGAASGGSACVGGLCGPGSRR